MYTDDRDYTAMRLENTVVRDKKEERLVTIQGIRHDIEGFVAEVIEFGRNKVPYFTPLSDLDLSSPPLGNVDYQNKTFYVARLPKRNDWRQGLRRENLVYTHRGEMWGYNFPSLSPLKTPVYNKYKPYKECLGKNRAFSREFSLDVEGRVWYKCREKVGKDIDGAPVLDKKFTWLKEALEDALE